MGNRQTAEEKTLPRTPSDKPKRTRQIRLTEDTYMKISKLGDLTEDWEDVIARITAHYLSCPYVKQEDKEERKGRRHGDSTTTST